MQRIELHMHGYRELGFSDMFGDRRCRGEEGLDSADI